MAIYAPRYSHTEYFAPPGADRLWSRVPYQRADLIIVDLDDGLSTRAQVVDSDTLIEAQAEGSAFFYGFSYQTPDDVDTLLHTAGLDEYLSDEDYPGWL